MSHVPGDESAPFDRYRDIVRPEWIDHNGHMNVGYYGVVFDYATDAWLDFLGLDRRHRAEHGVTTFTLEAHFTYQHEVVEGDTLRFTTQLLGFDEKRIHYLHRMFRAQDGVLAATNELMSLHVSADTRRGAPMHADVLERIVRVDRTHAALTRPVEAGRTISLRARAPAAGTNAER
jgi:acyl-CoA thioester hydrolase